MIPFKFSGHCVSLISIMYQSVLLFTIKLCYVLFPLNCSLLSFVGQYKACIVCICDLIRGFEIVHVRTSIDVILNIQSSIAWEGQELQV